jgi:hypothetical protein
VAGSEDVEDLGGGVYRIRYTISESNPVANGSYDVVVTARDAVGLETSGSVALVLDNEGAEVSTISLSDADNILNADDVITATVSDADNVLQAAEYYIDVVGLPGEGTPMTAVDGAFDAQTEEVTAPLSIASLSEGQHMLYVRAQDVTGEWGVPQALIFVVDRIPPAIQAVSVTYPENQLEARDTQEVMFTATVTDAVAGVDPARVLLTATDVNTSATDLAMFDDGSRGQQRFDGHVHIHGISGRRSPEWFVAHRLRPAR